MDLTLMWAKDQKVVARDEPSGAVNHLCTDHRMSPIKLVLGRRHRLFS